MFLWIMLEDQLHAPIKKYGFSFTTIFLTHAPICRTICLDSLAKKKNALILVVETSDSLSTKKNALISVVETSNNLLGLIGNKEKSTDLGCWVLKRVTCFCTLMDGTGFVGIVELRSILYRLLSKVEVSILVSRWIISVKQK